MDGLFYLIAGGLLTASFFKDRQKTKKGPNKSLQFIYEKFIYVSGHDGPHGCCF